MAKVKSSSMGVYLKASKEGEVYNRVGANCSSLSINFNPVENEYADVTTDVTKTELEGYKVSVEGSGKYEKGDPIYELFHKLHTKMAVLDDAKFPMLLVYRYDNDKANLFEDATVTINSINLAGSETLEVDFKISANCNPVEGTATLKLDDNFKTAKFTKTVTGVGA